MQNIKLVAKRYIIKIHVHTIQCLMLSKGAKGTIIDHITVIMQYCWDKIIARSGDMYKDDSGLLSLVIKTFGITNTSAQKIAIRISSVKTVPKCLRKLSFLNKCNIEVSSLLMSSLRAIVICQNYSGNHVISSEINCLHLYLKWGVVLCDVAHLFKLQQMLAFPTPKVSICLIKNSRLWFTINLFIFTY